MRKNGLVAVAIAVGFCVVLATPTLVSADIVWSEDFEEGLADWTTVEGSPQIIYGCLRGTDVFQVSHPSSVAVGSWSFDAFDLWDWEAEYPMEVPHLNVYFMKSGNDMCYLIVEHLGGLERTVTYYLKTPSSDSSNTGIVGTKEELSGTLHRFKITRTEAGQITLYVNGTHMLSVTDTELTSSETFEIYAGHDWAIDNIVVDDTPPGIPLELLAIGIGGAAVVIVAIVVFLRRR